MLTSGFSRQLSFVADHLEFPTAPQQMLGERLYPRLSRTTLLSCWSPLLPAHPPNEKWEHRYQTDVHVAMCAIEIPEDSNPHVTRLEQDPRTYLSGGEDLQLPRHDRTSKHHSLLTSCGGRACICRKGYVSHVILAACGPTSCQLVSPFPARWRLALLRVFTPGGCSNPIA